MYSLALIIFVVSEKRAFEQFPINASSLKPLGQLKPNCTGIIIGRSPPILFMPIANPRWPLPQEPF
jgi:hypothetical protein